jgi:DNA repair protein RadC
MPKAKTEVQSAITKSGKKVTWRHPGGKFRRLGPETCTDAELLSILIGAGAAGRSAMEIATEIIEKFDSFRGLANQPLEKLYRIKSLKEVKVTRIAAAFEIARRIVNQVLTEKENAKDS